MDQREELAALRRLAELEAKAGGKGTASAPPTVTASQMRDFATGGKKPDTMKDVGRSFSSGLAGTLANANPMNAFGFGGSLDVVGDAANLAGMIQKATEGQRPTGADITKPRPVPGARAAQAQLSLTGQNYDPKTTAGEWAKTGGAMFPNAFAPGSALARTAAVALPTIGTEGAGQIARKMGASPQIEAAARFGGGLAGGLASSVRVAPAAKPPRTPPVKVANLRSAKNAAYDAADQAGVSYAPAAFERLVDDVANDLQSARLNPARNPKAASMLEELQGMKGQAPTLTQLDDLRQIVRRDVAGSPSEKFFADRIIKQIDAFTDNAGPQDVLSGSAGDASTLIRTARDLNTRYRKVESVTTALDRAERRAGRTGSGGNVDNATRQNLDRILDTTPNLTAEEQAALRSIVMGGKGQNLLRQIGKLSPQGNGLMAGLNLGAAAFGGPLGAIPAVAGLLAKLKADRITSDKVRKLIELMAAGGKQAPNAFAPAQITFDPGVGLVGTAAINSLAETR